MHLWLPACCRNSARYGCKKSPLMQPHTLPSVPREICDQARSSTSQVLLSQRTCPAQCGRALPGMSPHRNMLRWCLLLF